MFDIPGLGEGKWAQENASCYSLCRAQEVILDEKLALMVQLFLDKFI